MPITELYNKHMRFKLARDERGLGHLLLFVLIVVIIGGVGFTGWKVYQKNKPLPKVSSSGATVSYDQKASRELTGGTCQGAGPVSIGPPMKLDQVSFVLPYGLVAGGHVTPVDHQYYNGLDVHALRDTYDVIAPADGTIIGISHRGSKANTPPQTVNVPSSDEYRFVLVHTCSFLTYVDLVTSVDSSIIAKLGSNWDPAKGANADVKVKKGDVIGHIGGQTLDFAVWDLSKPLKGFITPANYNGEPWKIFTAPTTDYLDKSIKDQVIAKYVRSTAPIDGKIDYDINGKAIGNWFLEGTYGYAGSKDGHGQTGYWAGHLSIAPDFIDPSVFNISIGNYDSYPKSANNPDTTTTDGSGARQYMAKVGGPDPATVDQSTRLVKYELVQKSYVKPSGEFWDSMSLVLDVKASSGNNPVMGTVLLQMTSKRTLKFEAFPGKTAGQVSAFDSNAKIYTR